MLNDAAVKVKVELNEVELNEVALNEVRTDFVGVPRPQGKGYDIGAYECKP
jgi:hypothetical protein